MAFVQRFMAISNSKLGLVLRWRWRAVSRLIIQVGRWSLCPVLQQQATLFTPLSNGEGKAVR